MTIRKQYHTSMFFCLWIISHVHLNFLSQGHPKDKILVDKEENGEVVLKEPATDTKTDSNEAASDCSNKVEITPSISPEDDVVENNLADDIRPLKKAKSSIDEICSSQASNG